MSKGSPKEQMVAPLPTIKDWSGVGDSWSLDEHQWWREFLRDDPEQVRPFSERDVWPIVPRPSPDYTLRPEGIQGVSADIVIIDDHVPYLDEDLYAVDDGDRLERADFLMRRFVHGDDE